MNNITEYQRRKLRMEALKLSVEYLKDKHNVTTEKVIEKAEKYLEFIKKAD